MIHLKKLAIYGSFTIFLFFFGSFILSKSLIDVPMKVSASPSPKVLAAKVENRDSLIVTRIIDGDTIVLSNGHKVRYIGINTPEVLSPKISHECYSEEASQANKNLVEGKEVKIEKDISDIDKYGRDLDYVWVGGIFVNDYLVKNGFAKVETVPPDIKYKQEFLEDQKEAQQNKIGLWSKCIH